MSAVGPTPCPYCGELQCYRDRAEHYPRVAAVPARQRRRGGPRPGAGRPPRTDTPAARGPEVALTEAERAELTAGLRDGETLAGLLREGGLALVRRRR